MRWSITEHLQIVWCVLVVTADEDCHQLVQEGLTASVVTKERISVYEEELALVWMWEAKSESILSLSGVQAEQGVQPLLNWVTSAITNWLFKAHLREGPAATSSRGLHLRSLLVDDHLLILLSQTLEELEAQTAACAFITMHS